MPVVTEIMDKLITGEVLSDSEMQFVRRQLALDDGAGKLPLTRYPDSLPVDKLVLGEHTTSIFETGTLTRLGSTLRLHDGLTPGGVSVTASSIDARRSFGSLKSLPFGTAGSTVKRASVRYYQELGRLVLPGSQFVSGRVLTVAGTIRSVSNADFLVGDAYFFTPPALYWDYNPQSYYFGASPTSSLFGTSTLVPPSVLGGGVSAAASSRECDVKTYRRYTLASDGLGSLTITPESLASVANEYGVNTSTNAAFTGTRSLSITSPGVNEGQDLVLVLVAATTATATRWFYWDMQVSSGPA